MLQITKQGNSIVVEGLNHYFYPYNGTLEVPCNSVITVVDEGNIVLFRSAANYDVLFSAKIDEITINGQSVTKDNVGEVFGALSNANSGGLTPEQEEKLNNAVQISDYNADKAAQTTIDEAQTAEINKLKGDIAGKQDVIQDLNAIREGADLGKTALQEETDPVWTAEKVNYYTKSEVDTSLESKADKTEIPTVPTNVSAFTNDVGYLTEHQSLDNYYTKTESDGKYATQVVVNEEIAARISDVREVKATLESKADKSEIPSLNGYATEQWVGEQGYLTEHQPLKTINGESIIGSGDIVISGGGEETDPVWTAEKVNYYTKTEVNSSLESKADKTEIPSLNGYATEQWVGQQGYLTEHQSLKTINGETIVGNGNITISGGEQISDVLILPQNVEFTYKDGNKYEVKIRDISYNSTGGLDYTISIRKNGVESTNNRKIGNIGKLNSSLANESYNSSAYGYKISKAYIPEYVYIFSDDDNPTDENKMYFDLDIPLISGTNIKTINGESILGSGDIVISGGGEETDPVWTAEKVNYYTKTEVNASLESKADKSEIPTVPTNVSAFTNDAGYLTEHQDISGKQDVITDLAEIRNGSALGKTALQSFTETDPTVPSHVKAITEEDIAKWNKGGYDVYQWSFYRYSYATEKASFTFTKNGSTITGSQGYILKYKRYSKTGEIDGTYQTASTDSFLFNIPLTDDTIFIVASLEEGSATRLEFSFDVVSNIKGGGITEETDPVWTAEKGNYYTKSEIDGIVGNVNNALSEIING